MIKVNACELVVTTHTLVIQVHLLFILLQPMFGDHMGKRKLVCYYSLYIWVDIRYKNRGDEGEFNVKKRELSCEYCFSNKFSFCITYLNLILALLLLPRYMAPPPYDPYGGYPVPPVQMPTPAPMPAPSSYVPVQVCLCV